MRMDNRLVQEGQFHFTKNQHKVAVAARFENTFIQILLLINLSLNEINFIHDIMRIREMDVFISWYFCGFLMLNSAIRSQIFTVKIHNNSI